MTVILCCKCDKLKIGEDEKQAILSNNNNQRKKRKYSTLLYATILNTKHCMLRRRLLTTFH